MGSNFSDLATNGSRYNLIVTNIEYYYSSQVIMGACAKKMGEAEISPEHYERKSKQANSMRFKSNELPSKPKKEAPNMMTWSEVISLNNSTHPDPEDPATMDPEIQSYLESTQGRIIRRKRKEPRPHQNQHMAVNAHPADRNYAATMCELNHKLGE